MSTNLSRGPVQVMGNTVLEINDALRQLQDRLDGVEGLRGRGRIFDRVGVEDPSENKDAVNLATRDATDVVKQGGRMTYGTDFVKYTDVNGTDLHGMGNL